MSRSRVAMGPTAPIDGYTSKIDWHRFGAALAKVSIESAARVIDNPEATPEAKNQAAIAGLVGAAIGGFLWVMSPPRIRYWKDRRGVIYRAPQ